MAYFRKLDPKLAKLQELLNKNERWLILINADPDALASAMALKRILAGRVEQVAIAHVNEITRPDNLAMIRGLGQACFNFPQGRQFFNHIKHADRAVVAVQNAHRSDADGNLAVVTVDAIGLNSDSRGGLASVRAVLQAGLGLRPGKLLATALLYGIKTDTQSFEREFHDNDMKAFRYLSKFYNKPLLHKIIRSEFRLEWLKYFTQAFRKMRVTGKTITIFMGKVDSSDILVVLADFFLRVHGLSTTMISGISDDKLVIVFRGDGLRRDMGKFAKRLFRDVGSAGGHKSMARAEIPMEKLGCQHASQFVWERLHGGADVKKKKKEPETSPNGAS